MQINRMAYGNGAKLADIQANQRASTALKSASATPREEQGAHGPAG